MTWYLPVHHPVLWEEMRRRLRGVRGHWMLLAYGLALLLILIVFSVISAASGVNLSDVSQGTRAWPLFGHLLWIAFLIGQIVLITLVGPGITAGAISTEREKGTLEQLYLTPIDTLSLTVDKFIGAIGQLLMVVLSGLPIIAVVFVYGGVSPLEVVAGYCIILLSGVFYASLGFLASCLFRRTLAATIWAYGFMFIVLAGLPLLFLLLSIIDPFFSSGATEILLAPNPLISIALYTNGQLVELWRPLLTMAIGSVVVLAVCVFVVFRLRGARMLVPRHVSLEVARFNSRARSTTSESG